MDIPDGSCSPTFEEIWKRYYAPLLVFCRMAGSVEPEDTVQEILLKVFRGLASYEPGRSFKSWLYAIARNHLVDERRKLSRSAVSHGVPYGDLGAVSDPTSRDATDAAPIVLGRTVADCSHEEAARFLGTLSSTDRTIAHLRLYESMRYRQIAEVLQMPVGTVKYRVHQIRLQYRHFQEGCVEAD